MQSSHVYTPVDGKITKVDINFPMSVESQLDMSGVAKVSGALAGVIIQVEELLEDIDDSSGTASLNENRKYYNDLKPLRVAVVQISSELQALLGENYPAITENKVEKILKQSKETLGTLKKIVVGGDGEIAKETEREKLVEQEKQFHEIKAREFAFNKILNELKLTGDNLIHSYDVTKDNDNIADYIVLKRKEMKATYSADFERMKMLLDRLFEFTDVVFADKEKVINYYVQRINDLQKLKYAFENKLIADLETNDLTEQKMKYAHSTKFNFKFSGSLDRNMDYYTFKTKFTKAYTNHPKNLLVEIITSNHLEGKARECVGSLEDIEEIWQRLKDNFGNTELMLQHHFKKLSQLGLMKTQKSFDSKKLYVQSLVNVMQDVLDLATEHDLTGNLHYGTQLQKVIALLDVHIQNKWYEILAQNVVAKTAR